MCKKVSKINVTQNKRGDVDMTTITTNNVDFMLAELLKQNREKIKSIAPLNPTLSKDDEWRNEHEWDELYKETKNK